MICVAIRAESPDRAREEMGEARRAGAALCELRLDYAADPDPSRFLAGRPLPVLVTVRPRWEGGRFGGSEGERRRILEAACRCGAEYVDYEFRAGGDLDHGRAGLVLSFHDFEGTPGDVEDTARRMRAKGAGGVVKLACRARGAGDLARLVRLQRLLGPGSAVVAMGEHGTPLRILYARYGGWITYASLREGAETAPGQRTVEDLVRRYRVPSIGAGTEVYGLTGGGPPWGEDFFNEAFRAAGRDARCVRIRAETPELLADLSEAMGLNGTFSGDPGADPEEFLRRAERQFRSWTGRPVPGEVRRAFPPRGA